MSFAARAPTGAGHHHYGQPSQPRKLTWVEGDIAFLVPYVTRQSDYDALPVRVPEKATCHPVIILAVCSTGSHFVVTTVSAYGADEQGGPAPWQQGAHKKKSHRDFRSFEGTAPYVNRNGHQPRALLRLEPGMRMPKPRSSWVYARSVFKVPANLLGVFNKSPMRLRVERDSLDDLRGHMTACSYGDYGYRGSVGEGGQVKCECCGTQPPQVVPLPGLASPVPAVKAGIAAAVTGGGGAGAGGRGPKSKSGPNRPCPPPNAPTGPRSSRPAMAVVPVAPAVAPQAPRTWAAIAAGA